MSQEFEFRRTKHGARLNGEELTLVYSTMPSESGKNFFFDMPGEEMLVSARDLTPVFQPSRYHPELLEIINGVWEGNCLESGAGLGQFAPEMAKHGKHVHVIDPVDYTLLFDMIVAMQPKLYLLGNVPEKDLCELSELKDRANTIITSDHITHHKMLLGDFVRKNTRLFNSFSLVVDNYGPSVWTETEGYVSTNETVDNLHWKLLCGGGLFYTCDTKREKSRQSGWKIDNKYSTAGLGGLK